VGSLLRVRLEETLQGLTLPPVFPRLARAERRKALPALCHSGRGGTWSNTGRRGEAGNTALSRQTRERSSAAPSFGRNPAAAPAPLCSSHSGSRGKRPGLTAKQIFPQGLTQREDPRGDGSAQGHQATHGGGTGRAGSRR